MSDNNSTLNVTLNGPVFGVFVTIVVWAIIITLVWGGVVTEGVLFAWVLLVALCGIFLAIAGAATWYFYKWAARGFKPDPSYRYY